MTTPVRCCKASAELLPAYLDFCRECWGQVHDSYLLNDPENYDTWRHTLVEDLAAHEEGKGLAPGMMPSARFWIMDGARCIGAADLRLKLNDALCDYGGHLGLVLRPSVRGQGHSRCVNMLLLEEARKLGLAELLITCVAENTAAKRALRSIPGIREEAGQAVFQGKLCDICRFYWTDPAASL